MKKITLPILGLVIALSFFSCKKEEEQSKKVENTFTLNADIIGITDDYLVYYENDDTTSDGYHRDTLWIKDNKFTFKDSIQDYKVYFIDVPQTQRTYTVKIGDKEYRASTKAHISRLWFIGYPGAAITFKGKINGFLIEAYPSDPEGINDDLAEIHKKIFPLIDKTNIITVDLAVNKFEEIEAQNLIDSRDQLYNDIHDIKIAFIKSHPTSVAATYIFSDMFYRKELELEQAKALFNRFDTTKLAVTPFYKEVKTRFKAMDNTQIGMQAPDLVTENTLDGKEFKLSSLKGNYVLLDYWGTWCGPCMAEIPKIKEYYKKYSDRNFEVVGVNSGDTEQRWKNGVKDEQMNWMQIRSTKEMELLTTFNVNSFPTKILIDPEGKIIYSSKNTEEKVDLYQILDTIFSKS